MKKSASFIVAVMASGLVTTVLAHSGHGVTAPTGLAHYLVEPLHLLQAFAPLAMIAATVWLLRRKVG